MANRYKKIREIYGLSRSAMSKVLGMGINQWRMYENGVAEPTKAHGLLIEMVRDPRSMLKILVENRDSLINMEEFGGIGRKLYEGAVCRCEELLKGYRVDQEENYKQWVERLYE